MELLRHTTGETSSPALPSSAPSSIQDPHLDLEDFYCILQLQPNDSFMALQLTRRLEQLGRLEEAVKVASSLIKIDYCFATVLALGQIEYKLDRIDEALNHLRAALSIAPEQTPEFFELFKTLGNIFVRKGDFDEAEDSYNKAHRLNPESDVLLVNFGALLMQRQQWDDALLKYRRALEVNSRNDRAWVGLALSHRRKGDTDLAWGNVEAALEHNPLNDVALALALEWSTQIGKEFRALELIRRFLISGGWNEKMSLAFVWLSWRRGESNAAQLELARLLAVNPSNSHGLALLKELRGAS